ncbi:Zinc/iron permease [Aaosphaeria arxii CBS 175.79]|uniref:Zinc/iron permease n=1 Tax=Aaosphaeria arxii CBS 175.79 TaxID=1450172 RepID=A0A6A5XR91_9PLEO|nr:Zinc/iron permease [Aaosphaeria arxii CBS 175.79]KAF2015453.1 Zinc/iron permease [Aaosphaeria arxii CBS 175.79]
MWEGLFMLLSLSTIMAIASFLVGALPLSFSLSPRQLRFITLLGTGVLVGTSLIVIIPEGIETMYSASGKGHMHVATNKNTQPTIPSVASQQKGIKHPQEYPSMERNGAVDSDKVQGGSVKAPAVEHIVVRRSVEQPQQERRKTDDKQTQKDKQEEEENHPQPQRGGDDDSTEGHKEGHTRVHAPEDEETVVHHDHDEGPEPHAYIGVALVLGFILMFLVDHLPEAIAPQQPSYHPLHISLSDLSRGPHNSSSVSLNNLNVPGTPIPPPERKPAPKSSATTIGLIIHACADGIALGASSTAPSTSLSFIIFFAIMLHKGPAAFGLTTVLLKQGLSKRTARTHLVFFSLAAPVGALVTWTIVNALGRASLGGDDSLNWTTGWVLLFSGGTFLYVAMHAMTEATAPSLSHEDPMANGYVDSYHASTSLSKSDIATVLFGMLVPLVTQVGHVH